MKMNPYEVLKVSKDSTLDEIIVAYYSIIFNKKSTFGERDRAYRAFKLLTDPRYDEYIISEDTEEVKRRAA